MPSHCHAPRPGRCVLLDQDVMHRVTAPEPAAPAPRYSLVLKLLLVPPAGAAAPPPLAPGAPEPAGSARENAAGRRTRAPETWLLAGGSVERARRNLDAAVAASRDAFEAAASAAPA